MKNTKMRKRTIGTLGLCAALLANHGIAQEAVEVSTAPVCEVRPGLQIPRAIDLVICLDTSGSMQGLIDSARQKIWSIVNDLALAKPEPRLRVGLLAYGGDGYPAENGYVSVQTPLTEDLDLVSQKLFELQAHGSVELVGRVLDTSTRTLDWCPEYGALKLIVIAGNESADQDQMVPFREACKRAIAQDIMVDAIYCGPEADDIAPQWREVARLADGKFASIDPNNGTIVIASPFDEELGRLSSAINTTYIPYGASGRAAQENQVAQDSNAAGMNSEAAAQRAVCKGSNMYRNSFWDLVDACKSKDFDLAKLEKEELPENMRKMSLKEQRAYIAKMGKRREGIQKQIAELSTQRRDFVDAEMRRRAAEGEEGFDQALRKAIREQAGAKGFQFPEAKEPVEPTPQEAAPAPESAENPPSSSQSK